MTVTAVSSVEAARRDRRWRQGDLAARAEVHRTVISRIEHGLMPGPIVRGRIAEALGLSEEALWPSETDDSASSEAPATDRGSAKTPDGDRHAER